MNRIQCNHYQSINTSQDTPGYTGGFSTLASGKYHYEWEVSENRYLVPAIGTRRPTDKIRQEDSKLVHGNLNTKIVCDTEAEDSGGNYDPSSNYRFTVPSGQGGKYFVTGGIKYVTSGNAIRQTFIFIYKAP